jgi:hypothetical protein
MAEGRGISMEVYAALYQGVQLAGGIWVASNTWLAYQLRAPYVPQALAQDSDGCACWKQAGEGVAVRAPAPPASLTHEYVRQVELKLCPELVTTLAHLSDSGTACNNKAAA